MKKFLLSFVALFFTMATFAVERITIKEFLEKADTETVYELAGTVGTIKSTKYGNFYLKDDEAEIYIYGLVTEDEKYDLITTLGIKEGDNIVIQGAYFEYNDTPEVKDALYISHESGENTGDDPANDGSNIIKNGGFEEWANGVAVNWVTASSAGNAKVNQSEDARTGDYAAELVSESNNKRIGYKETVYKAGTYKFVVWAKNATDGEAATIGVGYAPFNEDGTINSSGYKYCDKATVTDEWAQYSYDFTLDTQQQLCLVVRVDKNTANVLIDDAELLTEDGGIADGDTPDPETPEVKTVTISEALDIIDALADGGKTTEEYIVEGEVTEVAEISLQYGNATFDITDGENVLKIFRCKDFDNKNFEEEDKVKVGDKVKVQGKLQKYVKDDVATPELVNGWLLDINGTGIEGVAADIKSGASFNLAGQRVSDNFHGIVIKNGKKILK